MSRAGVRGAILAALLVHGCGGGETAPRAGGSTSRGGLDGPDSALAWTLEPVWTAGGLAAPAWAAFGEVTGLAFDAAGHVYVLDARRGAVTVMDSTGGLVRTVGSPGEGPGELRHPSALAVHPDGRVTVYDPGNGGFVVFGSDGTFVGNVPVPLQEVPAPEGPLRVTANGGLVTATRLPVDDATANREGGGSRRVVVYSDRDGGGHRTVHAAWRPPLPRVQEPGPDVTGGVRVRLPPVVAFHPALLVAPLADGGLAVADTTTWRVTLLDAAGRVTGRWARSIPPTPVTDAMRAAERERRLAAMEETLPRMMVSRSGGGSAAAPSDAVRRLQGARIRGMGFHPVIPVLADLSSDGEGRLWARRSGTAPGEPGPVDVLDASGTYLGTLPPEAVPEGAVFGPGGRVAVPGMDAMGAPLVRVFRLATGR